MTQAEATEEKDKYLHTFHWISESGWLYHSCACGYRQRSLPVIGETLTNEPLFPNVFSCPSCRKERVSLMLSRSPKWASHDPQVSCEESRLRITVKRFKYAVSLHDTVYMVPKIRRIVINAEAKRYYVLSFIKRKWRITSPFVVPYYEFGTYLEGEHLESAMDWLDGFGCRPKLEKKRLHIASLTLLVSHPPFAQFFSSLGDEIADSFALHTLNRRVRLTSESIESMVAESGYDLFREIEGHPGGKGFAYYAVAVP